tara:strand:- start:8345 stop:9508 length:1164 start_codon:yes stop_codon:yes gene_type:complete
MRIIIFGTGNYVTGRRTSQFGTILPAIFESHNTTKIRELILIATTRKSRDLAEKKIKKISKISNIKINYKIILNKKIKSFVKKYKKDSEDATCAIIATPDHTHYKIAKLCLQNKYHTLVVKPVVNKLSELKDLIKTADLNNVYGAVEFHKRFDRQAQIMKDKYVEGFLGTPLYSWTEYSQRKIVPEKFFKSWVSKNNVFQYLGIHYVDLIRFITKAKPISVMAIGQKKYLKDKNLETDDAIQVIVKWQTKKKQIFTQTLLLNWIDPKFTTAMSDQKLNFVGTLGRIELDQKKRGVMAINENNYIEEINPDFCRMYQEAGFTKWKGYGIESIKTFIKDTLDLENKKIKKNKLLEIRPSFEESIYSTAVLEAANKSLKKNSSWKKIFIK